MELDWPIAKTPPKLIHGDAHVWAVPLGEDDSAERELWNVLADDEKLRAEEFRIERPRRQFVMTRGSLRMLLGQYLGELPERIDFTHEAIGKPRLSARFAPIDVRFNVSHSGDLALVAVTTGCDVGVDVEQHREVKQLEQLARRYFHTAEIDAVLATAVSDRNAAFMRCWTAKEAVLKAFGTGIAGALDAFAVPIHEPFAGWIDLSQLTQVKRGSTCCLERLAPSDEYAAAIAYVGSERKVSAYTFSA
jgi:4'-phosphopantetheinyl transferase